VLNLVLSAPLLLASRNANPTLHPLEIAGVALRAVGLVGESIADRQLAAFRRDPANKGQVCDVGLWRYSRHPNYFFEWTIWVGYAAFALASPLGALALASPALMLHFLINVTGVRATEAQALRSKGEKYRRYQERTSMFVPLPPKH
jgi:steroid 5-alpha reductase family enzyme